MEAVIGQGDRAADRFPGVADHNVDASICIDKLFSEGSHGIAVREVGRMDFGPATPSSNGGGDQLQLLFGAGDQQHPRASGCEESGTGFANTERRPSDENRFVGDGPAQPTQTRATTGIE